MAPSHAPPAPVARATWLAGVSAPLLLFALALFVTAPHSRIPRHPSDFSGGLLRSIARDVLDPAPRCGLDAPGHYVFNASLADPERWRPEAALWRWHIDSADGCRYSITDFDDFLAAFEGQTLTFVGDSTMRTIFFDFACALLRCLDGSDRLGPREGDGAGGGDGWDAERTRQCEHCEGGRYVPSAVLRLGPRYGGITLRWYWLSWMDYLPGAPAPESVAWAEDWRSYVDTIPREWDFDAVFNREPGDFVVLGLGLWELKYPGWPANETEPVDLDAAVAYFAGRTQQLVDALGATTVGGPMAAAGRFVFRGLPIAERGTPRHMQARAEGGVAGPLPFPHYAQPLTLRAQAAQAALLDATALPYFDVVPYTHYALSQAVTGLDAAPPGGDGFQLTTDGTHPRPVVSLLQMRAMLSFFADSALLR